MKGLILGLAAGIAAGYAVRKMADEGKFDKVCDEAHEFAGKAKQKVKDVMETGKSKAENMAVEAKHAMDKGYNNMEANAHPHTPR